MSLLNIKFADGNELVSYNDDTYHWDGCPTCDYGSKYVNDISIMTTNYSIEIELSQMYEYTFSTADAIKIFAINMHNMSEIEFLGYVKTKFEEYGSTLKKFEIKERK